MAGVAEAMASSVLIWLWNSRYATRADVLGANDGRPGAASTRISCERARATAASPSCGPS